MVSVLMFIEVICFNIFGLVSMVTNTNILTYTCLFLDIFAVISDIANSLCDMILSHFSAVIWLNVTYIFKVYEYLVHAMTL